MAGYVQAWRFRLPGLFVFAPSAGQGTLDLDFVSGRLGRLGLPAFVFDWAGGMVARGILLGQGYAQISEISVNDGALTFAANVNLLSVVCFDCVNNNKRTHLRERALTLCSCNCAFYALLNVSAPRIFAVNNLYALTEHW